MRQNIIRIGLSERFTRIFLAGITVIAAMPSDNCYAGPIVKSKLRDYLASRQFISLAGVRRSLGTDLTSDFLRATAELATDPDPIVCVRACELLGECGSRARRFSHVIVALLDNEEAFIRCEAVRSLILVAPDCDRLEQVFHKDQDASVRMTVIFTLADWPDAARALAVLNAAFDDAVPEVRAAAIDATPTVHGADAALVRLTQIAVGPPQYAQQAISNHFSVYADVRLAACLSLARCGGRASAQASALSARLLEIDENSDDEQLLRAYLARAIAAIDDSQTEAMRHVVERSLELSLDSYVQCEALETAVEIGEATAAMEARIAVLCTDDVEGVAELACQTAALLSLKSPAIRSALSAASESEVEDVRCAACNALAAFSDLTDEESRRIDAALSKGFLYGSYGKEWELTRMLMAKEGPAAGRRRLITMYKSRKLSTATLVNCIAMLPYDAGVETLQELWSDLRPEDRDDVLEILVQMMDRELPD